MKKNALLRLCSVALFVVLCFLMPSALSYLLLILLGIRVYIFLRPTKGEKIPAYESPQKALLVMDVQEAMCGREGIYPQGDPFIERINQAIMAGKEQNQQVIYICQEFHRYDCVFCFLAFGGRLLQGTKNASLCSNLEMAGHTLFIKHQQDAFTSKNLVNYLKENQIDAISIVGLDAAACVSKTAIGAMNRGYSVSVIQDGVMGKTADSTNRALANLSKKGVTIVR